MKKKSLEDLLLVGCNTSAIFDFFYKTTPPYFIPMSKSTEQQTGRVLFCFLFFFFRHQFFAFSLGSVNFLASHFSFIVFFYLKKKKICGKIATVENSNFSVPKLFEYRMRFPVFKWKVKIESVWTDWDFREIRFFHLCLVKFSILDFRANSWIYPMKSTRWEWKRDKYVYKKKKKRDSNG